MARTKEGMEYLWSISADGRMASRDLTGTERIFAIFNETQYGQNCAFLGASISIRTQDDHPQSCFSLKELQERAVEAFSQTRWNYPTVASRPEGEKLIYNIESKFDVRKWSERNVSLIQETGGWLALRERLSRETALPTKDGDCCRIYLVVQPEDAEHARLTKFDVLLNLHHTLVDGAGIRSILNEFLTRLSNPLRHGKVLWGQEVERLLPASVLLSTDGEHGANSEVEQTADKSLMQKFFKPDTGLPLYRPSIVAVQLQNRGTLLVSHTFSDPDFLTNLRATGRQHNIKLTATIQAALAIATYKQTLSDEGTVPRDDQSYNIFSALDQRNDRMKSPYNERNAYVNNAAVLQSIEIPCKLVKRADFWETASHVAGQWAELKRTKGLVNESEWMAKSMINAKPAPSSTNTTPPKPPTCPYYVSDPPGSQQLSPAYPVSGLEGTQFVLESYQLATDQSGSKVSARSHSWNGRLTLCLVFNAVRNPIEKMREFLDVWVKVLEDIN